MNISNIKKLFVTALVAVVMLGGVAFGMEGRGGVKRTETEKLWIEIEELNKLAEQSSDQELGDDEPVEVDVIEESTGLSPDRKQKIINYFTDSVLRNKLLCDAGHSEEMEVLEGWYECTRDCEEIDKKRLKYRDAHLKARRELRNFLTTEEEYVFAFQHAIDETDNIAMIAIANARVEWKCDEYGKRVFALVRNEYDLLSGFLLEAYRAHGDDLQGPREKAKSIYKMAADTGFAHAQLVQIIHDKKLTPEEKSNELQYLVNKTNYPEALYYLGKKKYCPAVFTLHAALNKQIGPSLKKHSGIIKKEDPLDGGQLMISHREIPEIVSVVAAAVVLR
ncbi:hypothetical protein KAT92_03590 [Candidatus Babeliales bacterium]|nr:hypothetical protein [Candidatus Babeliales bacterium]